MKYEKYFFPKKEPTKTLMQIYYWEFNSSLLGKKLVLSLGMSPFTGSINYIRKKDHHKNIRNLKVHSELDCHLSSISNNHNSQSYLIFYVFTEI